MSNVNLPCVSLSTGTLSPDLRVNYQFGMVLGLNEFLQEQEHNLFLDHLQARSLHGYGTVYGAQVTTSVPSDAPQDVQVTVAPGMLIDQWGRDVVIRSPQCARLGAWLAEQELASPGTIASNLGLSGELIVYVVASYAQCQDDLVPLPGQPCSSSAQVQVPSRLRDAWDIELRFAPPHMPAWDAVRRVAGLLNSVQVVTGLPAAASSESAIIQALLALPAEEFPELSEGSPPLWPPPFGSPPLGSPPPGSPPDPVGYQLPAETAADAMDRILTVWVTQVRPQLAPDLTQPGTAWDPAVLLSTLVFTPASPFVTSTPVIDACADPDDTGRPYLLHTQLIQELRPAGSSGAVAAPLPEELVTLSASADVNGVATMTAWFHLGPVSLPTTISVAGPTGSPAAFSTLAVDSSAGGFSELWTLNAPTASPGFTVADGEQLAVTFPGTGVMVGNSTTTLAAAAAAAGVQGLDASSTGDITAYAVVRRDPAPPAPIPPTTDFMTLTYVATNESTKSVQKTADIELWLHPDPNPSAPFTEGVTITTPTVTVYNDLTGQVVFGPAAMSPTAYPPVWTAPIGGAAVSNYLRIELDTDETSVQIARLRPLDVAGLEGKVAAGPEIPPIFGSESLTTWITNSGLNFLGWRPPSGDVHGAMVGFLRLPLAPVT